MESLIKQTRVRFFGVGQENKEASDSVTERKIPLQITQSFKGERKKSPNWFRRQFATQMNMDDPNGGDDYATATAIAAAAFAVNSREDSVIADMEKKERSDGLDRSLPTRTATDKKMPEKAIAPNPSIKKTPAFTEKHLNNFGDEKLPEKAVETAPSIKKAPTFVDKALNSTESSKLLSTTQPALPPTETSRQRSTRPGIGETKADAWERAELAKIKERYEILKSTIQSWEGKKKEKAKRQKDRTESELEKKRARASQRHRSDMESINQIAAGARAQAEERRRNEELKVKAKANKIRVTGKLPATCFCF